MALLNAFNYNPFRSPQSNPFIGGSGVGLPVPPVAPVPVTPYPADDATAAPAAPVSPTLTKALASPAAAQTISIGPPPSDALAQALLANEQTAPLNTPFEALGKLGQLWAGTKAEQDYQKKLFDRSAAPAQALSQALAGIAPDTPPAEYRRRLAQTFMDVGGKYANPDMISKGAELLSTPTNYIQMKDAAGNDYLVNPYDMTDVRGFDANGNLVKLGAPPSSLAPADGSASAGGPASDVPGADPYAKFRLPRNIKPPADAQAYNEYLAQEQQLGVPPDKVQTYNEFSLERTRAGAQQQSIITNPAKTLGEGLAQGLTSRYEGFAGGVEGAEARQREIHIMQNALQNLLARGGTTGLGAEEIKKLQSEINVGATALGFDRPFDITDKEFLSSGAGQIAGAAAKNAVGARVTNFEMGNYLKANPGLETDPTFGTRMLGINAQIEQRNIDIGNAIRDYTAKTMAAKQEPDARVLEQIIRDYDTKNHITDPITGQDLTVNQGAVPVTPAPAPATPPVKITGDADYNALPSGTHFVGPDGKERVKP